jgi:hypothetical protein
LRKKDTQHLLLQLGNSLLSTCGGAAGLLSAEPVGERIACAGGRKASALPARLVFSLQLTHALLKRLELAGLRLAVLLSLGKLHGKRRSARGSSSSSSSSSSRSRSRSRSSSGSSSSSSSSSSSRSSSGSSGVPGRGSWRARRSACCAWPRPARPCRPSRIAPHPLVPTPRQAGVGAAHTREANCSEQRDSWASVSAGDTWQNISTLELPPERERRARLAGR